MDIMKMTRYSSVILSIIKFEILCSKEDGTKTRTTSPDIST